MDWCKEGDSTLQKRLELFLEQKRRAERQMRELEQHIQKIEKKIRFYETAVKAGTAAVHIGKSCDGCD
jgi:DNA-binding protein YbaB